MTGAAFTSSLAVDLGASGGKSFLGSFDPDRSVVFVKQVRVFQNHAVAMGGHLYWDIPRLWEEIKESMKLAGPVSSIGIDSWGVDFALLREGEMLGLPYAYRDPCFKGAMDQVLRLLPKEEIFQKTGIQFLEFNTLYQLFWLSRHASHKLRSSLLMIPDLFHYYLTGIPAGELTNATTTQLMGLDGRWWEEAMRLLGIELELPTTLKPSANVGELGGDVSAEVGFRASVILPATHDTASAIAAAPEVSDDVAYVSSGTWDLVGLELSSPIATREAMLNNFSNEGGAFKKFNFLRNVQGMWIIQGLKRSFERADGREYSYEEMVKLATSSPDVECYVDVDDPVFALPRDMSEAVIRYLEETGQPKPMGKGEMARAVMRSLAMKRRYVVELAGKLSRKKVKGVNVVGGGSKNSLLNQMTADVLSLPVFAGPDEATAVGNLLVQQVGLGSLSRSDLREVVMRSFRVEVYEPKRADDGYPDFLRLIEGRKGRQA
ncbi:MAG: rhamnulokinase [Thermoprotei archaeon]